MSAPLNKYREKNPSGGGQYKNYNDTYNTGKPTLRSADAVEFYKGENINPELFTTLAEKAADRIRTKLNSTQLRRFFGEIKGYYQDWKNKGKTAEEFDKIFPLIKMVKSKVFYAYGRKTTNLPREFAEFLLGGIDQINNSKDFETFILYFEAVVGFLYGKEMVSR